MQYRVIWRFWIRFFETRATHSFRFWDSHRLDPRSKQDVLPMSTANCAMFPTDVLSDR